MKAITLLYQSINQTVAMTALQFKFEVPNFQFLVVPKLGHNNKIT